MEIIEFVKSNLAAFTALGSALMLLGGLVVKATPTKKDDEWWKKGVGWIQKALALFGKK